MSRVIKDETPLSEGAAQALRRLGDFLAGELTWAEVEGMTWEEARAIARIGCELAGEGRLDEARVIFEGLVEGNPKDAAARAALGTVYQKLGRTADALAEYSAALEGDPHNTVALANRGELRLRADDPRGLEDLAAAVQADPHGKTAAGQRAGALVQALTRVAVGRSAAPLTSTSVPVGTRAGSSIPPEGRRR